MGKEVHFGDILEKKNQMARVARKSMTPKEQLDYMYSQAQLFSIFITFLSNDEICMW